MEIAVAVEGDWPDFLVLAKDEGWRVPPVEEALLTGVLAPCVSVLRQQGAACGFVSAVCHGRNGWIGNLIVAPAARRRGYGERLFAHALAALEERGARSLWLTASELGRPLYERHGFVAVDGIERWISPPRARKPSVPAAIHGATEALSAADRRAWGERRLLLLGALTASGQPFACKETVALLQGGRDLQVLGPWYSATCCPRENRQVLSALLAAADPEVEIACDLLASSPLRSLLAAAGFAPVGGAALMVSGDRAGVDLRRVMALASLGSMG
ncbi:GNAT family acetyltransferase [Desulfuromonas soudanensis]|uniref:GNAT family acetyltransferase n=1 Tax=Desulfuromonas soudanensis TaxID=1603606 RepID=A0A0M4CY24_9BACT|nr:GNAT family N-acetyltransferase [Desulfuromonas soudanensis]ALC17266.1 GNAT family acetyltransferase [Desulfuromonas soudanensis]